MAPPDARRLALGLAAFQAVDALACAIPLRFIKDDLDRLGCPRALQRSLPVIKGAAALGLAVGGRVPPVGAVTATALVAYFGGAIAFHVRAGDHPIRSVPAATLGLWAAATAARLYGEPAREMDANQERIGSGRRVT